MEAIERSEQRFCVAGGKDCCGMATVEVLDPGADAVDARRAAIASIVAQ